MRRRAPASVVVVLALGVSSFLSAPSASAAPPANDARANAQPVQVPSTVAGTTVESTHQSGEPEFVCAQTAGTVWYRFRAPTDRGVVVRLAAGGNLDAELDIFQQRRSALLFQNCDVTDDNGIAAADFRAAAGATYLIRVGELAGSDSGPFTLRFVYGPPPAHPPGRRLSRHGAAGILDRVLHVDAAYHLHLTAGRAYRFNLVHDPINCMQMLLYPPGTTSFESTPPAFVSDCAGYSVFAPPSGTSGRYFIRVIADRYDRRAQRYRLLAGPARRDDIAPGRLIAERKLRSGRVNGRTLDVVDIYRFNVVKRSEVDVVLRSKNDRIPYLDLRTDAGAWIGCGCTGERTERISVRLRPGRYFAAVHATVAGRAPYTLRWRARAITRTTTTINGRLRVRTSPEEAVSIAVTVTQAATGRAFVDIQHFDPFVGWLPYRRREVTLRFGYAQFLWTPPSVGRWRASAAYPGTKRFAPSESTYARVIVVEPVARSAAGQRISVSS